MTCLVLQPIVEMRCTMEFSPLKGRGYRGDRQPVRRQHCVPHYRQWKGIEPETLERLNDYLYGKNEDFKSIGIKNVNRRIGLSYGDGYGIKIQSVPGNGTMVTVVIPLIPESGGK